MHILLISPFPPRQNPRLVKEYTALCENGYQVQVVFADRDKWASNNTDANFYRVAGKHGSFLFLCTRLIHKIIKYILPLEYSYNRASLFLYFKARSIKADIYIAHNLAALPIAVKVAKKHHAKVGFDAEDFHRNEITDDTASMYYIQARYLEDKYLPQLNYFSAASPLIAKCYQQLYPFLTPVVINNVFSKKEIPALFNRKAGQLKLFWFSQTIGKDRGIESVISVLNELKDDRIELHLLGNYTPDMENYFRQQTKFNQQQLFFYRPIAPEEIVNFAKQFDVGLALETACCFNRNICLTNKIFTYLVAGLALIATDTAAQQQFLNHWPGLGVLVKTDHPEAMANAIRNYLSQPVLLQNAQNMAITVAQTELNWEAESEKLLAIVKQVLKN